MGTHYDVLGLGPDASPQAIRMAYRERARRHHPDRAAADVSPAEMSAINEAYRVLGDPGRRALYDRSLASPGEAEATARSDADHVWIDEMPPRHTPLAPDGPARVPWKLMLVAAGVGSVAVLVGAAFNDPPSEETPDGILRVGSCVAIEPNGDAREIACTNTGEDITVELVLPTDAGCPWPLVAHRDRLGLGIACIDAAD